MKGQIVNTNFLFFPLHFKTSAIGADFVAYILYLKDVETTLQAALRSNCGRYNYFEMKVICFSDSQFKYSEY